MAIFGRRKEFEKRINAIEQRSKYETRAIKQKLLASEKINKMLTGLNSRMQSMRTMSDELYPSTDKTGPFSGLLYSTNENMRRKSRIAHWQSSPAQELISRLSDLVIGHGLRLESSPAWRILGRSAITEDQRSEWTKNVEARYHLWAKSKEVDYKKQNNVYQLEQQEFVNLLIDGEYFELYRYTQTSRRNPMTIQVIKPEDVRTPTGSRVADGNTEHQGIEYNSKDQPVAYHIYNYKTCQTVRVARVGSRSGRVFVNHVKLGDKRRGIPLLADSVHTITKLGDWSELELQAAIINALFAIWIEPPEDMAGQNTLTGGVGKKSDPRQSSEITDQYWQDTDNLNYDKGGVIVDQLPAGHKVQSFDSKRPNINFGTFYNELKQDLAASKGLSLSTINMKLEGSYSSARGELLLVWIKIMKMRMNQGWSGNSVRYKMWLWSEVASRSIEAPGWNESDEMRDAWSAADWVGSQRPDIDPLRSVKAAAEDQRNGYKTGQQITAERGGGDYDENLTKTNEELKRVAENQRPFEEIKQQSVTLNKDE